MKVFLVMLSKAKRGILFNLFCISLVRRMELDFQPTDLIFSTCKSWHFK